MTKPPSISEEREKIITLTRQLGGKRTIRVTCDTCQNVYLAGSGHRGSLACQVWTIRRRLHEVDFATIGHCAWEGILREAGVPVELALTRGSPYPNDRVWNDEPLGPAYGNVRSVSSQAWAPSWASRYVRQTTGRHRMFRIELMKLALRVRAEGHEMPPLYEDLRAFSVVFFPPNRPNSFQRVIYDGSTYW